MANSDAIISNFNENIFLETKNRDNSTENKDCTKQGNSSESDDDNHSENDNADNIVSNYWTRLRPSPVILPGCFTIEIV